MQDEAATDDYTEDLPAAGPSVGIAALDDLRATRRHNRMGNLEWFELAWKVYIAAFIGGGATLLLASWIGDGKIAATTLAKVTEHGPSYVGALAALAIAIGLRSGSRGGPLAMEPAEVRHVLLAPIDRAHVLRRPAARGITQKMFTGMIVGAIAGELAHHRLPGSTAAWLACGGAAGALVGGLFVASALFACGLRIRRWLATLLAIGVLTWAGLDVGGVVAAPTSTVGSIALWPVRFRPVDLALVAVFLVVAVIGVLRVGRLSLEAAERRSALVGQLRFAVTIQDLRTVIVLRRQLAQDRARERPWARTPRFVARWAHVQRDLRGILRFPAPRLARMVVLFVGGALLLRAAYLGTSALIIPAALLLYVAALDAIEPLAQEVDQEVRADSYPIERGVLLVRHLPVTAVLLAVLGLAGWGAVVAVSPTAMAVKLGLVCLLPAVWGAGAGAVISVVMGIPEPVSPTGQLLPPEVAGMRIVGRTAWPLVMAVLGSLPVIVAHKALLHGTDPILAAVQTSSGVMVPIILTVGWVRMRDRIKAWWRKTINEAQNQQGLKGRPAR